MARHIIALIGAGGKTTAMKVLAAQNREKATLVTTTTHIFPLEGCTLTDPAPEALERALSSPGVVWAGASSKEGKLGMLPPQVLAAGLDRAELVLYEADGARYHPLKLHRQGEPVLLPETTHCLVLAGLSALGRPIAEAVHRYEQAPLWDPAAPVTCREMAQCILETVAASGFPRPRIFLNQEDALKNPEEAGILASLLEEKGFIVRSGSLRECPQDLFSWVTG